LDRTAEGNMTERYKDNIPLDSENPLKQFNMH